MARIVRRWRLVRPGRPAVPVRLVAADGRWRVHLPLTRRTVLADSWSAGA